MTAKSRRSLPPGGIKATLVGGNTIGGALRERAARPDGYRHVDTPALIRRLQEMSANTYLFGIWDSPTDWDDLRLEFLPAAQRAGIDVIPYIVPPSETFLDGRASRPFVLDFVRWAKEFATLSVEYPALKAWAIDDFEVGANAELFTAEYMKEIKEAQDAVNPGLAFYTCAYFHEATREAFLDKHRPYIDGIIYPFLDGRHNNTTVASSLPDCLDTILALTDPRDLDLVLLIYTGRFLDAPLSPTEDYVAETLRIGAEYAADGRITGVIAYGTQQDGAPAPASDNKAMYGAGRLSLFAPRATIEAGTAVEASQRVVVDPLSPRYELSYWYSRDVMPRGVEEGSFVLEVVVDGEVVSSHELTFEGWNMWMQGVSSHGPVDLTEVAQGKEEITLAFRLRALTEVKWRYVDVGVDNLETIGLLLKNPGFEYAGDWELSDGPGPLKSVIDLYAADRPARILEAVRRGFSIPG